MATPAMDEKIPDTLFFRNLAPGVNVSELKEVFSEVGPLKGCFIVVEKEGPRKGQSKHFGFVQYALPEDAKEALETINSRMIGGKPLKLELAGKRGYQPAQKEKRKRKREVTKPVRETIFSTLAKEATIVSGDGTLSEIKKQELLRDCSVVVFGLSRSLTRAQVKKKLSKLGKINSLEYPLVSIKLSPGKTQDPDSLHNCLCIYTKQISAANALKKLSNKMWNDELVHVRRIKQVAVAAKSMTRCRLIVRNIAFNAKKNDLRKEFNKFGPVTEVALEQDATGKKHRGFGFVQYACKTDAQKAVAAINGKSIKGRPLAVDFALDSTSYKKLKLSSSDQASKVTKEVPGGDSADKESSTADNTKDVEDASDSEGSQDESEPEDEEEKSEEKKSSVTKQNKEDNLGQTIFIRNLSFESTEAEVYERFSKFGGVKYAKIARDETSGRSRGIAFVQFYKPQGYRRALDEAATVPMHSARDLRLKQKLRAGETLDKVNEGGNGIVLDGRPLIVKPAVKRDQAQALTSENQTKVKTDRRHLYLAREGVIHVTKETNLPKIDLNKRASAEREKAQKLKSPLFFVSPTRLSVRNLNRREKAEDSDNYVDDVILRKEFQAAAAAGMEAKLVGPNEGDPNLFPLGWPDVQGGKPKVTQSRILYEDPPLGTEQKKGRSKGFGFVEFTTHVHALACLRMINNNPKYAYLALGGKGASSKPVHERSRLIVEFAVENAAKVRERQRKVEKAQKRNQLNLKREALTRGDSTVAKVAKQPKSGNKPTGKDNTAKPKKTKNVKVKETEGGKKKVEQRKRKQEEVSKPVVAEKAQKPKKRRKKKVKEPQDNLDTLLTKYKSLLSTSDQVTRASRWFD